MCRINGFYIPAAIMDALEEIDAEDDGPLEPFPTVLPLDRRTLSWLNMLFATDAEAAEGIAAMVREIRRDDEAAHATRH